METPNMERADGAGPEEPRTELLPVAIAIRSSYHHRDLPNALRRAARERLESGPSAEISLRELARSLGVSCAAAYRHFASKDELLAMVAAQGFEELTAALRAAVSESEGAIGVALAYLDFATVKPGLFRLMFGPLLADRMTYPALDRAAAEAFEALELATAGLGPEGREHELPAIAAWGLIHGLTELTIDSVVAQRPSRDLARKVLRSAEGFEARAIPAP